MLYVGVLNLSSLCEIKSQTKMSFHFPLSCDYENSSNWGRPTRSSVHNHKMIVGDGRRSDQDEECDNEVNLPFAVKVQVDNQLEIELLIWN